MAAFIPAGAGGIINASHQMNQIIHNTIWVTGHFHLTLATTVVLTFFGAAYWLIPHLNWTNINKTNEQISNYSSIVWTVGMSIMSGAMHIVGLFGAPRRSDFSTYGGANKRQNGFLIKLRKLLVGQFLFIGIILVLICC